MIVVHTTLLLILVLATYCDLRRKTIPNKLTYGMIVAGLLFALVAGGRAGLTGSLIGLAVGGGIFFFFWLIKAMGGADVKLMAGVGAFLGWPSVLDALFYTALCGGIMAILFLVWKRKPKGEKPDVPLRKQTLPYGVAIAAGTILSLIF